MNNQRPPPKTSQRPPPMRFRPEKCPSNYIWANLVAVSPRDINSRGEDVYLIINGSFVVTARPLEGFPQGCIGLNDIQRTWMQVSFTDQLIVEIYDPFRMAVTGKGGAQAYLGRLDMEIGFATSKRPADVAFDQDELAATFTKAFANQIFAPGQSLLFDFKGHKLKLTIKVVELVDLSSQSSGDIPDESSPHTRGILIPQSVIFFFKDVKSPMNLKGSTKRVAASNPIIRPDFKFEELGIGGVDQQFNELFRRAFSSRIVPPGLAATLGVRQVRGILLYGPPGTGKTLIAREIGKVLNAREPKVVNGPEVLNKFVGQSEENVRKLFADAEKEQKEKGDESGLHVIIMDELDAICKKRGIGGDGGTGVGDNIVNQLLSKFDGVNQLNNILLIGMTNRKDILDEAILRPGRMELHLEVGLPDAAGRAQILRIHTKKARESGKLSDDVDIEELARLTRNYTGAELAGVVNSANSFAIQRHIVPGTLMKLKDDIADLNLQMSDLLNGIKEVRPQFGVNEESLENCLTSGIIEFSPNVTKMLKDAQGFVETARTGNKSLVTVLLHGPRKSGKTALAARAALDSKFPFIKMVQAYDMIGMTDHQKTQHLDKVFNDAHRTPLNVLILDKIEQIIEWVNIGPRFNTNVLSALKSLIEKPPPQGRSLLILATTSHQADMKLLELEFMHNIHVPNLQTQNELANVMQEVGKFDDRSIGQSISEIEQITGSKSIGVGIGRILNAIEVATQHEDVVNGFAEIMCGEINEANIRG